MIGRLVVGIGWFFALWYGGQVVGGVLAGAVAGAAYADPSQAAEVGFAAGTAFAKDNAELIWQVALAAAVVGTLTGKLPGTKY